MATISQTAHFSAAPATIYSLFLDEKKHSEFTGALAKIDPSIGGEFSVWDGYATGHIQELVANQKIVQTWRASDWPTGEFSILTIQLSAEKGGTILTLNHTNVPEDQKEDIAQGWEDYYWQPLHKYLLHLPNKLPSPLPIKQFLLPVPPAGLD